jgi:hypothetical protein
MRFSSRAPNPSKRCGTSDPRHQRRDPIRSFSKRTGEDDTVGFQPGLLVDRRQRLPILYRYATTDDVTAGAPFLARYRAAMFPTIVGRVPAGIRRALGTRRHGRPLPLNSERPCVAVHVYLPLPTMCPSVPTGGTCGRMILGAIGRKICGTGRMGRSVSNMANRRSLSIICGTSQQ